jgi:hypothetical protein
MENFIITLLLIAKEQCCAQMVKLKYSGVMSDIVGIKSSTLLLRKKSL